MQSPERVLKRGVCLLVFVFRVQVLNLRRCLSELRLGQLNNGCQAQIVSGLGQIESQVGLNQELLSGRNRFKGGASVGLCDANVPRDAVLFIA